jgi:hypothetical protein
MGVITAIVLLSIKAPGQNQAVLEVNTILMESTFKAEGRNAQGQPTSGTAFVMGRPFPNQVNKFRYVLITAAHVLQEMQGDTAVLDLRRKTDTGDWVRLPVPIPIRGNGQSLWTKHPDADVAVMYIRIPDVVSIPLVSTSVLADDEVLSRFEIHPGDELECLGYPLGLEANDAGFPILRSGKIASYPLLPTSKTKNFLFDFRIFKGNSGGPVYFTQSNRFYKGAMHLGETIGIIIGLVTEEKVLSEQITGPYSAEFRQLQLGLAVVVHAALIKEAINMLPSPETLQD